MTKTHVRFGLSLLRLKTMAEDLAVPLDRVLETRIDPINRPKTPRQLGIQRDAYLKYLLECYRVQFYETAADEAVADLERMRQRHLGKKDRQEDGRRRGGMSRGRQIKARTADVVERVLDAEAKILAQRDKDNPAASKRARRYGLANLIAKEVGGDITVQYVSGVLRRNLQKKDSVLS